MNESIIQNQNTNQTLLLNLNQQLENLNDVMSSISKDIYTLNKRQATFETELQTYRSRTDSLTLLNGTTVSNESSVEGPITRSKSKIANNSRIKKVRKKGKNRSKTQRKKHMETSTPTRRPNDAHGARTIIPWDELHVYSSEL